jgi:uncharacterized protein
MAMRRANWVRARHGAVAFLAIAAGALALPFAAHAQFFGDRWDNDQPYRRESAPSRGFFSFPFFDHPYRAPFGSPANPPPVESSRPPPPRKLETQPTSTVVVVGDSLAEWLAYGLEEIYADNPQIGVVRNIRANSGLIHYEPRNDTLDWSQAIKDVLATEKPNAIVVMLGLSDRVPLREAAAQGKQPSPPANKPAASPQPGQADKPAAQSAPTAAQNPAEQPPVEAETQHAGATGSYDFHTDEWAKLYSKRIDDMIAALKSKGVPILWVGLPAIRGPKATSDVSYLDDLYHEEADKAGIVYVDIWDGFVDENGRYTVQGPDFEGQIRRLRSADGVHFTKFGALKLAHLVDQELSRIIANPVAPAALPSPQASAPTKPGAGRPAVGPVLPLTANGGGDEESGDLLGGGSRPAPIASEDPLAANVLVHGNALTAPAGRADDFAWPPRATENAAPKPSAASSAGSAAPAAH